MYFGIIEISELRNLQRTAVDNMVLSLGKLLVENLFTEHFDPSKYSDAYDKELEKMIGTKVKGRRSVVEPQKIKEEETKHLLAALSLRRLRIELNENFKTPRAYNYIRCYRKPTLTD